MPKDLKGLSVFVASPGGLEAERKAFFETLSRFNSDDGHDDGVSFMPQGHELAYAGAGRPQELINEQIRDADYLLVVFWDKWGFASTHDGKYTSGTEEEFYVGLECLADPDFAMRDVVVFFKDTPDRQLSDPGEQLGRVLEFKRKLEAERRVLYRSFNDETEFRTELRRLLSKWSRDWRSGPPPKAQLPTTGSVLNPRNGEAAPLADDGASIVDRARAAAKSGQSTLAQQLFAQATTGTYDSTAWTEYVRFLRRAGRYGLLRTAAGKMIEKARDLNDHQGAAEGWSNLGIAQRSQGNRIVAIEHFDRALSEVDAWERDNGASSDSISMRAFLLDNKGLTWRRMPGCQQQAVTAINQAIQLHAEVGDERGRGHALRNSAVVAMQMGSIAEAIEALEQAAAIFSETGDERGLAMTKSSLGEAFEYLGDFSAAIEQYELAMGINTNLGNAQGKSMNLSQLSRAFLVSGNLPAARDAAEACLEENASRGNPEGLAAGLHALGRVEFAEEAYEAARQNLQDANEVFRELDQPAGVAGTALDLAALAIRAKDSDGAERRLEEAQSALAESPHYVLSQSAERLGMELAALT